MIPPRESEITRVEAFSDAMIAFAATLLVVSLETPRTFDELVNNLYGFFPFGLSFAALFLIWLVHTSLFRRYPLNDKPSILINGLLLFTVLFYVYPLKFLAASFAALFAPERSTVAIGTVGHLQTLFMLYAVGWMIVFSLFAILYRRAWTMREHLSLTPVEAYDAITLSRHYAGFVLAGLLSLIVAWLGIGVRWGLPGIAYASIAVFSAWNRKNRIKGRDDLATNVAAHPQLAYTGAMRTEEIQQLIK
jgi:Predicted integral membrane protein